MFLEELETQIGQPVKQAAHNLLRQAGAHMDAELVHNEPAVRTVKKRSLHLLARFGATGLAHQDLRIFKAATPPCPSSLIVSERPCGSVAIRGDVGDLPPNNWSGLEASPHGAGIVASGGGETSPGPTAESRQCRWEQRVALLIEPANHLVPADSALRASWTIVQSSARPARPGLPAVRPRALWHSSS
jgi:hypothetical protein